MSSQRSWVARNVELTVFLAVMFVVLSVGAVVIGANAPEGPVVTAGEGTLGSEDRAKPAKRKKEDESRPKGTVGNSSSGSEATPKPAPTKAPKDSKPTKPQPSPTKKPPAQQLYYVARIIDGDTLELGNGQDVRLVGIDTPERGECGYQAAADALAGLVLGKMVLLTISDEDTDQYGRLLRYVNIGTMDAGLRLIKRGLAIARYDSRDGYGYHRREGFYIDADRASTNFTCPKPAPLVGGTGGGNCAPGYMPCIPPHPPDLDCADVNGPIHVSGSDPHGLDADGDGVACEWD